MSYPTTTKEYVDMLKTAAGLPTKYWNQYPYNLGYYHSDGKFSFDCVNLNKAILNGWEPIKTVGYFQKSLTRTGDCNEWGFISQCEYSSDFAVMNCVAALYMAGHIGNYISEEVTINGKVYNAIECTGSWGGGVLYSYVDTEGRRFNHKGGSQNGKWTYWGKMTKWLKYEEPKPVDFPEVPFVAEVQIADLNYRKRANETSASKGYIPKGVYRIVKVNDNWLKVSGMGWIYGANTDWVKTLALPCKVKILINDLNLRASASTTSVSKGYVDRGTYTMTKIKNDWGYIKGKVGGKVVKGWIYLSEPSWVKIK